MALRNAHAQSQFQLADAPGFSGGLQSFAKARGGGFHGVIESHRTVLSITCDAIAHSYGSMQIFSELVIALTLVMVWMWRDAKNSGRSAWPWIVVTLAVGSFGPLLYFITGKDKE